ncbi:MAG: hypothetical protein Q7T71_18105, partial [Herbiconiux sp.]|nr:hypothetical protein [Herbiconiux sp.]
TEPATVAGTPTGRPAHPSAVRLGLGYVLGVREADVRALVAERERGGAFGSLDDLASRAGAGRAALEQLAWSGVCDRLAGGDRRQALWQLGVATPAQRSRGAVQLALPLGLPETPPLAPVSRWQGMLADYATTGLTTGSHPLSLLRRRLEERRAVTSAQLDGIAHGTKVTVAGFVVARQRPGTAKGVTFMLLEDEAGTTNLIIAPRVAERHRLLVRSEPLILATGRLERHPSAGGTVNIVVDVLEGITGIAAGPQRRVAEQIPLEAGLARKQEHEARRLPPRPELQPGVGEPGAPGEGAAEDAGDFRVVAPPVMSFAQGRRR